MIRWAIALIMNFFLSVTALGVKFSFSLSPMVVELNSCSAVGTFTLFNGLSSDLYVQAFGKKRVVINKKETFIDAPELVISPPQFIIAPESQHIARVGLRNCENINADIETVYRISFKQVKNDIDDGLIADTKKKMRVFGGISYLYAFEVPVYIEPRNLLKKYSWKITKSSINNLQLILLNSGNVRAAIRDLTVYASTGKALKYLLNKRTVAYPGEQVAVAEIRVSSRSIPDKIKIVGSTNWGAFSETIKVIK